MSFLYPQFLWAFGFLAVPILIHIFHFRRHKKVYFSNVKLLQSVEQERRTKNNLKHLLVLLSRLLLLSCLILAFAQPVWQEGNSDADRFTRRHVSFYIDNSFSMDALASEGTLLDVAKSKAKQVIQASGQSDRFHVLTNDFEAKHQRLVSKEEALALLDEIQLSSTARLLSDVLTKQEDILAAGQEDVQNNLFVVSDFQVSTSNMEDVQWDTAFQYRLLPVAAEERANLSIDSVWFHTPNRQVNAEERLYFRVRNHGALRVENVPVSLHIDDIVRKTSVSIEPFNYCDSVFYFTHASAGDKTGVIELTDHPVVFDDSYFLAYTVKEQIRALLIQDAVAQNERDFIQALFDGDSYVDLDVKTADQLDYATLKDYDLILLNQLSLYTSGMTSELQRYLEGNGTLVYFPHPEFDVARNQGLQDLGVGLVSQLDTQTVNVNSLDREHLLFEPIFEQDPEKNMDLPQAFQHYRFGTGRLSYQDLMKFQNGDSFLRQYLPSKGTIYAFSVPLEEDFSNLGKHAIFVAILHRIAETSTPQSPLFYTLGEDESIETLLPASSEKDQVYHVRNDQQVDFIPSLKSTAEGVTFKLHGQLKEAGQFGIYAEEDMLMPLAFNYNRLESNLSSWDISQLKEQIQTTSAQVSLLDEGTQLTQDQVKNLLTGKQEYWKILVLLTLIFLAAEIFFIKWSK